MSRSAATDGRSRRLLGGDGIAGGGPHTEGVLALPDPAIALGTEPERARRSARRVLRAVGIVCALAATGALTLPIERTVELDGRLVPAHVVPVRPLLDGLVTELLVAPGDTVTTGRLLARLFSPERATAHPRRSYLAHHDVYAPPTLTAGVVLTEDLDGLLGMRLDAGDLLLELAALDLNGKVPFTIRAHADEHRAQRVRPGMPARLTFTAVPTERPRQAAGRVVRVGPASERTGGRSPDPRRLTERLAQPLGGRDAWRVEIAVDPGALDAVIQPLPDSDGLPTELRVGFSVEVAVVERRETIAQTAAVWITARRQERRRYARNVR